MKLEDIKNLNQEINQIRKLKTVKKVKIGGGGIIILTKDIKIKYRGKNYNLGKYIINLSLELLYGEYRIIASVENVKPVKIPSSIGCDIRYDHPHIEDYSFCFGNFEYYITNSLLYHQLFMAVFTIIQALHSYDPDDSYIKLSEFCRRRNNG